MRTCSVSKDSNPCKECYFSEQEIALFKACVDMVFLVQIFSKERNTYGEGWTINISVKIKIVET